MHRALKTLQGFTHSHPGLYLQHRLNMTCNTRDTSNVIFLKHCTQFFFFLLCIEISLQYSTFNSCSIQASITQYLSLYSTQIPLVLLLCLYNRKPRLWEVHQGCERDGAFTSHDATWRKRNHSARALFPNNASQCQHAHTGPRRTTVPFELAPHELVSEE